MQRQLAWVLEKTLTTENTEGHRGTFTMARGRESPQQHFGVLAADSAKRDFSRRDHSQLPKPHCGEESFAERVYNRYDRIGHGRGPGGGG